MYVFFSIISEGSGKGFVYFFKIYVSIFGIQQENIILATVPPYTGAIIRWDKVTQDLAYITFKESGDH